MLGDLALILNKVIIFHKYCMSIICSTMFVGIKLSSQIITQLLEPQEKNRRR